MFGDDALEEQTEWMKKATFPDTDPEEAIEFESGVSKSSERELIKDVIAKNLRGEIKVEFVRNKGHKCVDLDEAIEIIRDCKRYVKVKTGVNIVRNEAKKKRDQEGNKKKSKTGVENICRKHKTRKWPECLDNKNSPNYTGNKGEKKRSEEKSIENKSKTNHGKNPSNKSKKNEAYVTEQKIN